MAVTVAVRPALNAAFLLASCWVGLFDYTLAGLPNQTAFRSFPSLASNETVQNATGKRGVRSFLSDLWKKVTRQDEETWGGWMITQEEARRLFQEYQECVKRRVEEGQALQTGRAMPVRAFLLLDGESVTMECLVCIRPDQDKVSQLAVWQHAQRSDSSFGPVVPDGKRVIVTVQSALVIKEIGIEDAGQYTCLDRGEFASVYQVDVLLKEHRRMVRLGDRLQEDEYLPSHNLVLGTVWSGWEGCDTCDIVGQRKRRGVCMVKDEMKAAGWTWAQLEKTAANGVRWRSVVEALCSPEEQVEQRKKEFASLQKMFPSLPVKPIDLPLISLFPEGLPCRSTAIPVQVRFLKAVRHRLEETLVDDCKEPCPTPPPPVVMKDKDGKPLELLEAEAVPKVPPMPKAVSRQVLYEPEGKHLVLQCTTEDEHRAAARWLRGKKRLDPLNIRRVTKGRVWVDGGGRLHIKRLMLSDTDVYNCWERAQHLAAIKVVVIDTINEKMRVHITQGGLALTVIGSLVGCCCVLRSKKNAR